MTDQKSTVGLAKCAVIVGAGPGLGFAVSRKFALQGFNVALVARNRDQLNQFCDQINNEVGKKLAQGFVADASSEQDLINAFAEIRKVIGVSFEMGDFI
jgi:short-subunit dehydrogenase